MKLILVAVALFLLLTAWPKKQPQNKISLDTSKNRIALLSAQVIQHKFMLKDWSKRHLKWHYELELSRLQDELSLLITYRK